jgi:hypothetical protein
MRWSEIPLERYEALLRDVEEMRCAGERRCICPIARLEFAFGVANVKGERRWLIRPSFPSFHPRVAFSGAGPEHERDPAKRGVVQPCGDKSNRNFNSLSVGSVKQHFIFGNKRRWSDKKQVISHHPVWFHTFPNNHFLGKSCIPSKRFWYKEKRSC